VNELPFTSRPSRSTPFAEFARELRARLRELYRVRGVPPGRVGVGLRPGVALAPVSVTYRRPTAAPPFPGLSATVDWGLFNGTARNGPPVYVVGVPAGVRLL